MKEVDELLDYLFGTELESRPLCRRCGHRKTMHRTWRRAIQRWGCTVKYCQCMEYWLQQEQLLVEGEREPESGIDP